MRVETMRRDLKQALTLGSLGGFVVFSLGVAAVHAEPDGPDEGRARPSSAAMIKTLEAIRRGQKPEEGSAQWLQMGDLDRERVLLQQRSVHGGKESASAKQQRRERAQALAQARLIQLRDAAKQAWRTLPGAVRDELRTHAYREATLRRILDVAKESSDAGALNSALQLLYVEQERHRASMAAMLQGNPVAAGAKPPTGESRRGGEP